MKKFYTLIAALFMGTILFSQNTNALHFDGVDDYISFPTGGVSGGNSRTVEAWIRTDANCVPNQGGVQQTIVDMGTFGTGTRYTVNLLWSNSIRIEVGGSGLSATQAINDSSWHHVVAVYKANAVTKHRLYIDGAQVATGNLSTTVNTTAGGLVIGRRVDGTNYFEGDIDDVRVWNTALTTAQIQARYQKELCSIQNFGSLKHYYKLNQGTPDGSNTFNYTAPDSKGTNDGTLQGFALSGSSSNWTYGQNLNSTLYDTTQIDVCMGMWSPDQSTYWDTTGTYIWTYPSANGCDSIVEINLSVTQIDTSVAVNFSGTPVFTSQESSPSASFQWVNCADSTLISGATSPSYSPTSNGCYAVIITKDSCSMWSSTVSIANIGLEEFSLEGSIYPNPATDNIHINLPEGTPIRIYSLSGEVVMQEKLSNKSVNVAQLPSSIYIIEAAGQRARISKL